MKWILPYNIFEAKMNIATHSGSTSYQVLSEIEKKFNTLFNIIGIKCIPDTYQNKNGEFNSNPITYRKSDNGFKFIFTLGMSKMSKNESLYKFKLGYRR